MPFGGGPQRDTYDGSAVASAWYEREVAIPAEWQNRTISLHFDRVGRSQNSIFGPPAAVQLARFFTLVLVSNMQKPS